MLKEDEIFRENYVKIRLVCPRCGKEKFLKIPKDLTKHSAHLTTISIPSEFVCKHNFQAFIDKDFNVRAYQNADFEINKIEFYESEPKEKEGIVTYTLSQLIKHIVEILRESQIDKQFLGGAIFNLEGKVMYSSLPDDIFLLMANHFENQEITQAPKIKLTILSLENDQKVLSRVTQLKEITLNVVILISSGIDLNEAKTYLEKLIEKIIDLERPKKKLVKKDIKIEQPPSDYWIYSKVNYISSFQEGDTVYIDSLGITVSKSVILNLDEIKKSKGKKFEGKIYFTKKYVNLMQGLALTLKDAAIFMSKLNKMP